MEEDPAINLVATKSKAQAELYSNNGNCGRAFAHFLVALNLMPSWKIELKEKFSTTLCAWGEQLESQQRFKDLFNCYEQAIETFPENEEIICNLGAHLFRLGHLQEAAHYFRKALDISENYLPAYRNLQSVSNLLVERWHFRMLNDTYRNEAYREAILKKIQQGCSSVLDIGTGSGLLSLFAATSGASEVHACDYSPTMCAIAKDVFKANGVSDSIKLMNKLSNDLKIPDDLPQRKSLVVTETMDSGLLGEHLLLTLSHAWDHLLKSPCPQLLAVLDSDKPIAEHGVVLPIGARLWACPIQCQSLAKCNYLTHSLHPWIIENLWFYCSPSEPYDTINLRSLKDCKFLTDPVEVHVFDFNNPIEIKEYYFGDKDGKCISFVHEEKADALAVWFDVSLDEDITITSSPFSEFTNCCWDQAIFGLKKPTSSLKAKVNCGEGKLSFEFVGNDHFDLACLETSLCDTGQPGLTGIPVDSEVMQFLNNKELQRAYIALPSNFETIHNVLDLSLFPMLGLQFLQKGTNLVCVLKSKLEVVAVKEFVKTNNLDLSKVKCLLSSELEDYLSNKGLKFDFVINNLFEMSGELKESSIDLIPRIMTLVVNPETSCSPTSLSLMCQLIDSEWISQTSKVNNQELTDKYKIAELINLYRVNQQLNIDLKNIVFTPLSDSKQGLELRNQDLAGNASLTNDITLTTIKHGSISGIALWYKYQLLTEANPISTFSDDSHINQNVFIVDPPLNVNVGDDVVVNICYYKGIVKIKVVS